MPFGRTTPVAISAARCTYISSVGRRLLLVGAKRLVPTGCALPFPLQKAATALFPGIMPKIMFFITEDWAFLSHRLVLGQACRDAGWEVVIATNVTDHGPEIQRHGFTLQPLPLNRRGANPFGELRTVLAVAAALRRHRPDILHCVALKPVLYGNLAAICCGQRRTVSALAGMGYAFTGTSPKVRALRSLLVAGLRLLLRRPGNQVIVQNDDDRALLLRHGIAVERRLTLIRGSGVDLAALPATPPPPANQPIIFALVARMLADKGIAEAVEAMRQLHRRGVACRLWLVGKLDPHNPSAFSESQLRAWEAESAAEWLGHREDIAEIWRQAHVALLPSYREGMPKALLEAAACGRPIITTDVIGCREVIEDGIEGILVPARESEGLANAMQRLAEDQSLRLTMGRAARLRAERHFGEERVVAQHFELYRRCLEGSGPCAA